MSPWRWPPNPLVAWLAVLAVIAGGAGAIYLMFQGTETDRLPQSPPPDLHRPLTAQELARAQERYNQIYPRLLEAEADGHPDAISDDAQRFAAQFPTFAPAHDLLGKVLMAMGEEAAACQAWQRCLELDPHSRDLKRMELRLTVGKLAWKPLGDVAAAEKHYLEAMRLFPAEERPPQHLVDLYLATNRPAQAQRMLLRILAEINPNSPRAHRRLADLFAAEGNLPMALDQIAKAVALLPPAEANDLVDYVRRYAELLRHANRPQEAYNLLVQRLDKYSANPEVLEDQSTCLMMLDQRQKAAEIWEVQLAHSLEGGPLADHRLAVGAARWRLRLGDREAARRHLETLRRLRPLTREIAELEEGLRPPATQSATAPGTGP